jgi:hypothetical protein
MRSDILLGSRPLAGSDASRNTGVRWPEGDLPRASISSFNPTIGGPRRLQATCQILAFWYRNSHHSLRRRLDFDHCAEPINAAAYQNAVAWPQKSNREHRPMHAEAQQLESGCSGFGSMAADGVP